ncbi:MAG: hypothetical protein ACTSPB_17305, partial [Candidatus Thorarchaeota archaeon]
SEGLKREVGVGGGRGTGGPGGKTTVSTTMSTTSSIPSCSNNYCCAVGETVSCIGTVDDCLDVHGTVTGDCCNADADCPITTTSTTTSSITPTEPCPYTCRCDCVPDELGEVCECAPCGEGEVEYGEYHCGSATGLNCETIYGTDSCTGRMRCCGPSTTTSIYPDCAPACGFVEESCWCDTHFCISGEYCCLSVSSGTDHCFDDITMCEDVCQDTTTSTTISTTTTSTALPSCPAPYVCKCVCVPEPGNSFCECGCDSGETLHSEYQCSETEQSPLTCGIEHEDCQGANMACCETTSSTTSTTTTSTTTTSTTTSSTTSTIIQEVQGYWEWTLDWPMGNPPPGENVWIAWLPFYDFESDIGRDHKLAYLSLEMVWNGNNWDTSLGVEAYDVNTGDANYEYFMGRFAEPQPFSAFDPTDPSLMYDFTWSGSFEAAPYSLHNPLTGYHPICGGIPDCRNIIETFRLTQEGPAGATAPIRIELIPVSTTYWNADRIMGDGWHVRNCPMTDMEQICCQATSGPYVGWYFWRDQMDYCNSNEERASYTHCFQATNCETLCSGLGFSNYEVAIGYELLGSCCCY